MVPLLQGLEHLARPAQLKQLIVAQLLPLLVNLLVTLVARLVANLLTPLHRPPLHLSLLLHPSLPPPLLLPPHPLPLRSRQALLLLLLLLLPPPLDRPPLPLRLAVQLPQTPHALQLNPPPKLSLMRALQQTSPLFFQPVLQRTRPVK